MVGLRKIGLLRVSAEPLFLDNETNTLVALMDSIKADHGFNMDSKSVRNLLQAMSEFALQERRDFLQFVTGSPKLPIGGIFEIIAKTTIGIFN